MSQDITKLLARVEKLADHVEKLTKDNNELRKEVDRLKRIATVSNEKERKLLADVNRANDGVRRLASEIATMRSVVHRFN